MQPEPGELTILHEDKWLLALDKPAGLAVHPGAGRSSGTLVHRLLARYPELAGVGGPGRPGIVHRLDLGTTGLLLVARTATAYAALSRAFAERQVAKEYLAVVLGSPKVQRGTIEAPIGRHPTRRKEMAVVPRGRPARTDFRVLAAGAGVALLAVTIASGRTHQIRVHLRHRGHPIAGDSTYGGGAARQQPAALAAAIRALARPALHAWRLRFTHPGSRIELALEAPVPNDLACFWENVTGAEWPPRAADAVL